MEIYRLETGVSVLCVPAQSFPKGIKRAFEQLYSLAADVKKRKVFGISKPQNGVIRYKAAAAENFDGEGEQLGCPTFIIKKGFYLGETLLDWQKNEMMIMSIFNRLVADKRLDGSAHCVEWYKSETELLCLALMKSDMVAGTVTELEL